MNLYGDGVEISSQTVLPDEEENWGYSFENLPKNSDGIAISYTVTEEPVSEYTVAYNGDTVSNSYTPRKCSITATIVWGDAEDQDGIRPDGVGVQLLADGFAVGEAVVLNEQNAWTHTWYDLPLKSQGTDIVYSLGQIPEVNGYASSVNSNEAGLVVNFAHVPETVDVEGQIIWDDADNQDGIRPGSVVVKLYGDGVEISSQTVLPDEEGIWSYSFEDIPKNSDGSAISYTVSEEDISGYVITYNSYTVNNSHVPEPVVVKTQFVDVDSTNWYYEAVLDVFEKGLMTGMNPTYFGAEEPLSRAQFAAILYRRAGYPTYSYQQLFPDVPDGEWYTQCVLWTWYSKVIFGYNDGRFGPADYLNREQLCTILWRYALEVENFDNSARGDLSKYPDSAKITPFAQEAIEWCEATGILNDRNGRICAWENATRADCATMISRFLKVVGKDK